VGGEDSGLLNVAARVVAVEGGCLDPVATRPYGGSRAEQEKKAARRNTNHHLGHRRKHGGKQPVR
jgi:hypothetical protein